MNRILLIPLMLIVLALSRGPCWSQTADTLPTPYFQNAIYATLGTLFFSYTVNANLERLIWQNPESLFNSAWIKAGGGRWAHYFNYVNGGYSASLEAMTMSGSGNHHFECCAGVSFFYDKENYLHYLGDRDDYLMYSGTDPEDYPLKPRSDFMHFLPSGSLGYRYQKPGAPILFRSGIGFPDAVYISLGVCF